MKRFLKIAIPLLVVTAGLLVGCHFLFIRSHTISFESNGGTPVASITLRFGTPMEAPEEPVKEGETFCGWYQDAELTHPYDFVFMGASDLLLYAAWSSPGLSFVLNDAQDGYVVSLGDARATGRIVVPAETGGLPVTEVAESGFRDCPALEEVFLPDSVEIIRAMRSFPASGFLSCTFLPLSGSSGPAPSKAAPPSFPPNFRLPFAPCRRTPSPLAPPSLPSFFPKVWKPSPNSLSRTARRWAKRFSPAASYPSGGPLSPAVRASFRFPFPSWGKAGPPPPPKPISASFSG